MSTNGTILNEASPRGSVVRFCTWCKEVCIRGQRQDDFLTVWVSGNIVKAMVNGHEIIVGDGICPACRLKEFPETVKSKEENSDDQIPHV
jgi:hypothetical protein